MGFLDRVKFALWASGFTVEVLIDTPVYEDLPVTGRVRMQCGQQPATVTGVKVTYRGGWTTTDDEGREHDHFRDLDSFAAMMGGTLQPGQQVEVPFSRSFDLQHGFTQEYEWVELHAEVDVPGAQNPAGRTPFRVEPTPPLDILKRALAEQLGWGDPRVLYKVINGQRWLWLGFGAVPTAYEPVIDGVFVCAQVVDAAHGHSILPAGPGGAPAGLPFVTRAGAPCAIAIECAIDRDGQGPAGLLKEMAGQDKIGDRYVARDVESAVARVRGFIDHVARMGPVR